MFGPLTNARIYSTLSILRHFVLKGLSISHMHVLNQEHFYIFEKNNSQQSPYRSSKSLLRYEQYNFKYSDVIESPPYSLHRQILTKCGNSHVAAHDEIHVRLAVTPLNIALSALYPNMVSKTFLLTLFKNLTTYSVNGLLFL